LFPERRAILQTRARIIQGLRRFFEDHDYLEVETPNRIPAPAPEYHIDPEPSGTWFLHPSPELAMKRLLAEGFERIFQICKCYRHGERGRWHLPEFTLLEWYRLHADYRNLMEECEALLGTLMIHLQRPPVLQYGGAIIDLTPPWERITVRSAFNRYAPQSLTAALTEDRFEELLVDYIEPHLGMTKPTFLYDYPREHGALARQKEGEEGVVERFELYIAGVEMANAFSELTDAREQRHRFEEEESQRRAAGKVPYPSPEPFLQSLARLGEAAGCALGLDRLVMLLTGQDDIAHCVTFPPEHL